MSDELPTDDAFGQVLAEYFTRQDQGQRIAREEFLSGHPEHADALRTYFADADLFGRLSAGGAPLSPAILPLPLKPPGEFGGYELLEELGRGGMGIVYKVREQATGRLLALKMLLAGLFASPHDIERFRNEAQAAANLRHPAIVPIYHVGEHQGHLFYTMPLVEGTNLARRLAESPFEPRAAAELIATVAEAVDYAHRQGVIHRDLKPANILLDEAGNPYVADFGVAHRPGHPAVTWTSVGDIVGTLRYMSPEQAEGQEANLDPRTDVYALGATLYEMLTHRPAFAEKDYRKLREDILRGQPVAPRMWNAAIPPELEGIVLRAVARNRDQRQASAAELASDLRRFLEESRTTGGDSTLAMRIRTRLARRPGEIVAAIAVVVSVVVLASTVLWRINASRDADPSGIPDGSSREDAAPWQHDAELAAQDSVRELVHPSNREEYFGTSLAVAHDRIFVGAHGSRSVYVYDADSRRLVQTINRQNVTGFGISLSVNDKMIAVGGHSHDSHAGVVTLYDLPTGKPLRAIRNPSPSPAGDQFGTRVALAGNRILVCAPVDSDDGHYAGAVYMFDADTGELVRRFASPAVDRVEGQFGISLAVTANHFFVGLPRSDASMHPGSVYQFDLGNGQLIRTLSSPVDKGQLDGFGYSLAILADQYLVVGAPWTNSEKAARCGAAYLFRIASGELLRTYFSTNPCSHGSFGSEVAAAGDNLAMISAIAEGPSIPLAGRVYAIEAPTGRVLATYESSERADGDWFGESLATWGDRLMIGAPGYGSEDRGAVFVFDLPAVAAGRHPHKPDAPARE